MGRTKGSKNKVKSETAPVKTTPIENDNIQNPGLKPAPVEKMLAEENNKINNKSIAFTLNKSNLPNSITQSEMEWKRFEKLVKDNTRSRLENIACSTIKWTELEEGMDGRVINYAFLLNGWCIAFKDPEYGPLALKTLPNFFNVNGNPTYASAYGFQGYMKQIHCIYKGNKELKPLINVDEITKNTNIDGVICRDNNYGRENFPKKYIEYVKEYAEILSNLKLGMLISAERLKQPFVLAVKKRALGKKDGAANRLIEAVRNNKSSIILIDEELAEGQSVKDFIEFIDLKGDSESPKKLQELWENQFNNFLSLFGINTNPTPDKTQYVNTTENNSNNELLRLEADIRFQNKEKWCEDCKDLLGLNMKCELNQDDDNLINDINMMKGELGNGEQDLEQFAKSKERTE